MNGQDQLRSTIEKLKCLLELPHQLEEVKRTCSDVIELINSPKFNADLKESYPNIVDDLSDLLLKFSRLKLKCPEVVLQLSQILTKIIKLFYAENSETALTKLSHLGTSVISWTPGNELVVAKKMKFINELLEEMQNFEGSSLEEKSLVIALFLNDIGKCYRSLNKHALSRKNFHQAINLIQTIGGKDSKEWKALGLCYYELGISFQQCQKDDNAREALLKAKEIIENSTDITEDETEFYLNSIAQKISCLKNGKRRKSQETKLCCLKVLVVLLAVVVVLLLIKCRCVEGKTSLFCNENSTKSTLFWNLISKAKKSIGF